MNVWQKPPQYYKVVSLQLKKKKTDVLRICAGELKSYFMFSTEICHALMVADKILNVIKWNSLTAFITVWLIALSGLPW